MIFVKEMSNLKTKILARSKLIEKNLKSIEESILEISNLVTNTIENEGKFTENVYSLKDKKKIKFFYLGPKNNWKKYLDKNLIKEMNNYYKEDLKKFGYEI